MPVFPARGEALLIDQLNAGAPPIDYQFLDLNLPDFTSAEQEWTRLSVERSILDKARFQHCTLQAATIARSNLRSATINQSTLTNSDFQANLMTHLQLTDNYLHNDRFKGCLCQRMTIHRNAFVSTLFIDVEARKSDLRENTFVDCAFSFTDGGGMTGFQECAVENCLFIRCTFDGYALHNADLTGSAFIDCSFHLDDWTTVNDYGAHYTGCAGVPLSRRQTHGR